MPKRNKQSTRPSDVNQLAHRLVEISTQPEEEQNSPIEPPTKAQISLVMAELGRKGGKIGGKRRLETMTAKERIKAAKAAAKARWSKQ
jgi:hypothetical protein